MQPLRAIREHLGSLHIGALQLYPEHGCLQPPAVPAADQGQAQRQHHAGQEGPHHPHRSASSQRHPSPLPSPPRAQSRTPIPNPQMSQPCLSHAARKGPGQGSSPALRPELLAARLRGRVAAGPQCTGHSGVGNGNLAEHSSSGLRASLSSAPAWLPTSISSFLSCLLSPPTLPPHHLQVNMGCDQLVGCGEPIPPNPG